MSKTARAKSRENVDLLIVNAEELLTLADGGQTPRTGRQMRELGIIHDGAIAVREGRIVAVGKTREVTRAFKAENAINAKGKIVLPGFVDPHTHLLFAGSCEDEFQTRVEDANAAETRGSDDDMLKTIKETRKAKIEKLVGLGLERLDSMMAHGTTTVEAKSGYGLTTEDEVKILEAMRRLNRLHGVTVVSTFLGAHAVPPEHRGTPEEYIAIVIGEMLPKVAEKRLAEFCDVSCKRGTFNLMQAKRILLTAKKHGLKAKIHADQSSTLGGAEIAAEVGAVSAEHLNFSSAGGVKALAEKGVIAVLLPAAAFSLMMSRYADARLMIDSGVPVALGTDFSPSCWVENQQLVIAMACHFMHMTPAEAITASTINAAHAVNRAAEVGSLEAGKKADILVVNAPNHRFLGYRFSVNLADKVIKNGRLVVDREKQYEPVFLSEA